MNLKQIIETFNDGEWNVISPIFSRDIKVFFNFLRRKNLLDRIDFRQIPDDDFPGMDYLGSIGILDHVEYKDIPDQYYDEFLFYKLEKFPQETLKFICDNILTDVEIKDDGYYLRLRDREELSELFRSYSRETSPRDIAKGILGEDDIFDRWWDTTDDVYRDVIEVLNKENLQYLGNYIVKTLNNSNLSVDEYDTDFFNEISNENGEFTITSENVRQLLSDEESMNELLNNDLSDLKSELHSIHSNSYNSAYENEVFNDVMSELERIFEGGIIEESSIRNDKTYYTQYIKIRDFYNDVHKFLNSSKDSGYYSDGLEYFGSYTKMMENLMDNGEMEYLDFSVPDYPNSSKVDEDINTILGDYI